MSASASTPTPDVLPPAAPAKRRRILPTRSRWAFILLGVIVFACAASIPFAASRVSPTTHQAGDASAPRGIAPRRFEASNLDLALLPPWWAPHRAEERAQLVVAEEALGRSVRPWLGTDRMGRDLLLRSLVGGAVSLGIGSAAAAIAVFIGTIYGALAGFLGGRVDAVMLRIVDVLFGLPYILLVVLLAVAVEGIADQLAMAAQHPDEMNAAQRFAADLLLEHPILLNVVTLLIAIGSVSWLSMARVIRGQVLSLKAQPFMEACRAIGVPVRVQLTRHLLPNLVGPIVVYATLTVPAAILSESFLSFLGIGVREPLPSWGNLAADGLSELNPVRMRWWLLAVPCTLIGLTLIMLNTLGESLRERLDPKRKVCEP
jgi:ABC-type dipeptide/oligopeptide/nickel transport system permease subunit